MVKKVGIISSLLLVSMYCSGTALASDVTLKNVVNTPNADFNEIGDALISSGCTQSANPNGDRIIWHQNDPIASYSGITGNWVYYPN